jgi:hypothetical protein
MLVQASNNLNEIDRDISFYLLPFFFSSKNKIEKLAE